METLLAFWRACGPLGGITLSLSGRSKRWIYGVLMAGAIWRLGQTVLALVQQTSVKIGIALARGLCSPFPGICSQAIWRTKGEPDMQGRVLATRFLLTQLATPLGR
ncbi:MAG: hypothetical protein AAGC93_28205 [Cyanobacteria bacterium P01_F01_bin.53]